MPSLTPELNDKEWLYDRYIVQNTSYQLIGEGLGCSVSAVQGAIKRHGIPSRDRTGVNSVRWAGGLATCKCAQCGAVLRRRPSKIAARKRQFCDKENCEAAWLGVHKTGQGNPNWGGGLVDCECDECGSKLQRSPSRLAGQNHQFCNKECWRIWRSKHRVARQSGCLFMKCAITPKDVRDTWRKNGGSEWRKACRVRDQYTCQRCGKVFHKQTKDLHVHHKVPFITSPELRNEEANGICLCKQCHEWIHSNEGLLVRMRWETDTLSSLFGEQANDA